MQNTNNNTVDFGSEFDFIPALPAEEVKVEMSEQEKEEKKELRKSSFEMGKATRLDKALERQAKVDFKRKLMEELVPSIEEEIEGVEEVIVDVWGHDIEPDVEYGSWNDDDELTLDCVDTPAIEEHFEDFFNQEVDTEPVVTLVADATGYDESDILGFTIMFNNAEFDRFGKDGVIITASWAMHEKIIAAFPELFNGRTFDDVKSDIELQS